MLIHRVEIAFLSVSRDLLRIEREQILLDLTCHKLTSDTSFTAKKSEEKKKASGTSFSCREADELRQNGDKSSCRKLIFKSNEILLRKY